MTLELTAEQIAQQNKVDNAIMDLFVRFSPAEKRDQIDWNDKYIEYVRTALRQVIVEGMGLMTEQEFYPYVETLEYVDSVMMTVTEEELLNAISEAISTDADDLAVIAGYALGGDCWKAEADDLYVFVPNENYTGAFGDEIEKREGLSQEPEDYNVGE